MTCNPTRFASYAHLLEPTPTYRKQGGAETDRPIRKPALPSEALPAIL